MAVDQWSTTAANNASSADNIDWSENQSPSTVNDSARQLMADVAEWYAEIARGTIFIAAANVSVISNAYTLTTTQGVAAYSAGQRFMFLAEATNSAAVTVDVDSVGAKAVKHRGTALESGTITNGDLVIIVYDGTDFELVTAVNKATVAETRAASTGGHAITTDLLQDAAAAVALTDAVTVAVDWTAGIYFTLTLTANRTLGNPTNEIPGTFRTILVEGDTTTDRTLSFGSEYGGTTPTLTDIDSTKKYLLTIFCKSAGQFLVTAIDGSDA